MTQVKGKVRICQSKINDFNLELISGTPFYQRYEEIRRVFIKHLPQTDVDCFGLPVRERLWFCADKYPIHPECATKVCASFPELVEAAAVLLK